MILLFFACLSQLIEDGEWLPGGDTTNTLMFGGNAFIRPAENILTEHEPSFYTGNSFFNQAWVEAPASTQHRDGLGPLFNARSCASCHFKDGRGAPPEGDDSFLGLLLKTSISGLQSDGSPKPSPRYGVQIQPFSILNVPTEANPVLYYEEIKGYYDDGEAYTLLNPIYELTDEAYGETDDLKLSPRVAPAVIGMGLLEAIPLSRLEELSDPNDEDGDGVSGKLNWVWDVEKDTYSVGRFGWKSEMPTVRAQVGGAFLHDIGITSSLFPTNNCADNQFECEEELPGGEPEISDDLFDKVVLYTALLAVPMRHNWDSKPVLEGKKLFFEMGCDSCHTPSHRTGQHDHFPEVSDQLIFPYTDLLLHDMGKGLADNRPTYDAGGSEWRTPPLWSIGMIPTVNGHSRYLHDGRARNLTEAILWHGGEASSSQKAFLALSKADRKLVIKFVESL
ncbi:MAG: di-heme oxidoredictase family protein [Myxococcota bacterium]